MLLCGPALAQPTSTSPSPPRTGEYFRGTFGTVIDQNQNAQVTLQGGRVVKALVASGAPAYRRGQQVIVWGAGGRYVVEDLIRTPTLAALLGLLVLAAALGRWKGLRAVIGAGA